MFMLRHTPLGLSPCRSILWFLGISSRSTIYYTRWIVCSNWWQCVRAYFFPLGKEHAVPGNLFVLTKGGTNHSVYDGFPFIGLWANAHTPYLGPKWHLFFLALRLLLCLLLAFFLLSKDHLEDKYQPRWLSYRDGNRKCHMIGSLIRTNKH